MATKTTGVEFKRFYNDDSYWLDGVWHEDEEVFVNGALQDGNFEIIPDVAIVTVSGGFMRGLKAEISFETFFKRWRKQQNIVSIVVEFDDSKEEAIVAAIKAAGGRILK